MYHPTDESFVAAAMIQINTTNSVKILYGIFDYILT